MSFIGGYQSNFNLGNLNIVGDFPIDHSIGGFGIAAGVNNYAVTLNTAISQYRRGLLLEIIFAEANTGPVNINVSGRGAKSVQKITAAGLQPLDAGDLSSLKIYLLVYDGQGFQVVNIGGGNTAQVVDANEDVKGIAQIATGYEVRDGLNDTKIVTPAKLAAYIADKVTGLWKDKGLMNCSGNPDYPAGNAGDAYTVNGAGKVGGPAGRNVELRDVIYCNSTNQGGTEAAVGSSWTILQANLEAATEMLAGYVRLASSDETNAGESLVTAVSPRRLKDLLNLLLRFQNGSGMGSIVPRAGEGNSAPEVYAAVLGGQNNRANAPYSIAQGLYADSILFNEWAKSGGSFYNVRGSAQCSILNLLGIIPPGNTAVPITADGNPGGANRWLPPNDCVQQFTVQLTITQNSGTVGLAGLTWSGIYEGVVRNQNGFMNWVGDAPMLRDVHQDPGFSPESGFYFGPFEVNMYVYAMVDRSLHVSATVYMTQTKFNLR